MPPDFVWFALVILLAIVALAMVGLMGVGAYLLYQLAREKRLESEAQWNQPVSNPSDEVPDEEDAARVSAVIDYAKDQNRMAKDEWREEKLGDGWTDEDIEAFLANRPLLELN